MKNKKKKITRKQLIKDTIINLLHSKIFWAFFLILLLDLYLRYWNMENVIRFGWDQARESWSARDILIGHFPLVGYPTGVGHIPIGPLYYYLIAPFYAVMHFDPMAVNYFTILANIVNFSIFFYVTKKIFNDIAALFVVLIYATNVYLITFGQTAWNVSLLPGIAALIFYVITRVYTKEYKYVFISWALCGFAFNFHFTAIFFPLIVLLSFIFVTDKKKVFLYSLYSIPLYVIWFVPNIIYEFQNQHTNAVQSFFKSYFLGFHLQFLIHQLPYSLVMFKVLIGPDRFFNPPVFYEYLVPAVFILTILFWEKDKTKKLLAYLISLWFIIPLCVFTMYGGPISEYYFIYDVLMVLLVFIYLQEKVLKTKFKKVFIALLIIFWSGIIYQNTKNEWIKPTQGGLWAQKIDFDKKIANNEVIPFNQGNIEAYMYAVYKENHVLIK